MIAEKKWISEKYGCKIDETWLRIDLEKVNTVGQHIKGVFEPFPSQATFSEEEEIKLVLEASHQLSPPLPDLSINMIKYNRIIRQSKSYYVVWGGTLT